GRKPTLAELRDSGSIEHDADFVGLLHQDENDPSSCELLVGKNRSGESTLNPDYFDGVSLTALANRLGLHKAILSAQAAEGRRKFGIKNRGQAHGWNFGKEEPKPPETRKVGALAEAAMSQLKARLFRSSQPKAGRGGCPSIEG